MKVGVRIIYWVLFVALISSFSFGLSCLALAGGYDLNAKSGQTYYFSFTIYNNDADPTTVCDPGLYRISLSIKDMNIDELFDYSLTDTEVILKDAETKKVMVTLTPKVDSGVYEILVTVSRFELNQGANETTASGTKIFNSTVGKIKINLGGKIKKGAYDKVPDWYVYEQKQKEELATNNTVNDNNDLNTQGNIQGPEPQTVSEKSNIGLYIVIAILIGIIIVMAVMLYRKR